MPLILPDRPKPYVMAHRGNSVAAPENTLAAFRRALNDGADILETDLHLTRDGVFVCIHDATLDRTTDGSGAVADLTLAEVKQYSADYGRSEFTSERVPALQELAAILPPHVALALELKTDRFLEEDVARQLVEECRAAGVADRMVVLSFNLDRALAVQNIASEIPAGLITLTRLTPTVPAQLIGPFWPLLLINPFYTLWARRRKMLIAPLDPWPDSRLWLYRLLGCDAVLTNDPARTLTRLRRRPGV